MASARRSGKAPAKLLAWYRKSKRDMPWRGAQSPWHILVSEFMLQQTTVATAIPYYRRFLKEFPSPRKLAAAGESRVLALWSGLGYYRRAKNLRKAAQAMVKHHAGRVPRKLEELRALPGVGAYTAAAVGSIAFGIPEPVIDGNVIRLMSRYAALAGNPASAASQKIFREEARSLLNPRRAGDSNQALMELGSQLCLPRDPQCPNCPLKEGCKAYLMKKVSSYPSRTPRPPSKAETWIAALYLRPSKGRPRILFKKNQRGANQGLWDLPMKKLKAGADPRSALGRGAWTLWGSIRHAIMDRRLHVHVASIAKNRTARQGERWISPGSRSPQALTGMAKKILALWQESGTQGRLF